jgi:serine/threonine protein phosphatase PrpC
MSEPETDANERLLIRGTLNTPSSAPTEEPAAKRQRTDTNSQVQEEADSRGSVAAPLSLAASAAAVASPSSLAVAVAASAVPVASSNPNPSAPIFTPLTAYTLSAIGKRPYQQDRSVVQLALEVAPIEASTSRYSLCDLYDGHGGEFSSEYLRQHLHVNLHQALLRTAPAATDPAISSIGLAETAEAHATRVRKCIQDTFRQTDRVLTTLLTQQKDSSGSCALLLLVDGQNVWVAHVGDSKAVLGRVAPIPAQASATPTPASHTSASHLPVVSRSPPLQSLVLTTPHTVVIAEERNRVLQSGATIDPHGRINGVIAISRSFGDRMFKNPIVKFQILSPAPAIAKFTIKPPDRFVLMASDGLWECMSAPEAVEFVQREIEQQEELMALEPQSAVQPYSAGPAKPVESARERMCRRVVEKLIREVSFVRAAKDNITITLLLFGTHPDASK